MQIWLSHPSSIKKIAFPLYLNSNANLVLTSIQVQFKTQLKVRQEDPIGGRKHPLLYAYYKITIAFCNGGALSPEPLAKPPSAWAVARAELSRSWASSRISSCPYPVSAIRSRSNGSDLLDPSRTRAAPALLLKRPWISSKLTCSPS